MSKEICILTDLHISGNPRVWKEADVLARNGYRVTILTKSNTIKCKKGDDTILSKIHSSIRYVFVYSTIAEQISFTKRVFYKFRTLIAILLKMIGIDNIYLIAKDPKAILKSALKENADLYIAHVDCSLYVGKKLLQKGYKVAYDFEDWYSKDYINPLRPVKLLSNLEKFAMHNGLYVTCPSQAMASNLQQHYNSSLKPLVLYNSFPDECITTRTSKKDFVQLVWFSQTIGKGRGIEQLIQSLSNVKTPVKLLLIGNCNEEYKQILTNLFIVNKLHTLEIQPQVSHKELYSILADSDIGLALEQTFPESRNKTITNKILQYLQSGLKILATNTDGQLEVAEKINDAIEVVDANDNSSWGEVLNTLIEKKIDRKYVLDLYNQHFAWKNEEKKILKYVADALED